MMMKKGEETIRRWWRLCEMDRSACRGPQAQLSLTLVLSSRPPPTLRRSLPLDGCSSSLAMERRTAFSARPHFIPADMRASPDFVRYGTPFPAFQLGVHPATVAHLARRPPLSQALVTQPAHYPPPRSHLAPLPLPSPHRRAPTCRSWLYMLSPSVSVVKLPLSDISPLLRRSTPDSLHNQSETPGTCKIRDLLGRLTVTKTPCSQLCLRPGR
ncbi:hypothetical protein BC628DRAFT_38358 [Trametes gibbosa]|nr:hypothetical protein BC628DRAFT_38358 [Trametes gibbosa]